MDGHEHPPGEFCDGCRPIIEADYASGEQFWRHYATPSLRFPNGAVIRYKVLSKKTASGMLEFVCLLERRDGEKEIFAKGHVSTDDQLTAFVKGIEVSLIHALQQESMVFELTDFRDCDTMKKWEYKLREGTTFNVWSVKEGETGGLT